MAAQSGKKPGSGRNASSPKGGRKPPAAARPAPKAAEAAAERQELLDDLDEDLAVEEELEVNPDDMADGARANGGQPEVREGAAGGLENQEGKPIIRDRRKVDPVTGQVRAGAGAGLGDGQTRQALEDEVLAAAEVIAAREELAVRTEDLQRLSAEYANYRKRVDRDRAVAGAVATGEVLSALIPVLDDIDAARAADELDGPFKAVAEKLEGALERFDLERYGAVGDEFDPNIHEALLHQTSSEATGPSVTIVIQPGYRMGERILRAARVGVTDAEA